MYRNSAGAYSVKPGSSILPQYSPISGWGSILPHYTAVGETPTGSAAPAALLFFTGLALGYVWGGTTGSFGK